MIPRSIAEEYGYVDAPKSIKKILGKEATLADVYESLWDFVNYVNAECITEIIDIIKSKNFCINSLKIYSSETHHQFFLIKTLSKNTLNKLKNTSDFGKFTNTNLRLGDLLQINNVGIEEAIEIACIFEASNSSKLKFGRECTDLYHQEHEQIVLISKLVSFFKDFSEWFHKEQKINSELVYFSRSRPKWTPEIKQQLSELENVVPGSLASNALRRYPISELIELEISSFDERLLSITKTRILTTKKTVTLQDLGDKFNVSRERIRQLENKALRKLRKFNRDTHLPLLKLVESLQNCLGNAVPKNSNFEKTLNGFVDQFSNPNSDKVIEKMLLLWLAGPYKYYENWLLKDYSLPKKTIDTLNKGKDHRGFIDIDYVEDTLNGLGICKEFHNSWIEYLGVYQIVESGLIEFQGTSLDKAYRLLTYYKRAMKLEEIAKFTKNKNISSFSTNLINDPRFWRINSQNEFVIAETTGYFEFKSIINSILVELANNGGSYNYTDLISKISNRFKVKESSVIAYLNTPKFKKDEKGNISICLDENFQIPDTEIKISSNCYKTHQDHWCLRVKVDKDTLRGSGKNIPNQFARYLGCNISQKIEVPTELGNITLSWPSHSLLGATVGSLKKVAEKFSAEEGDYIFIIASKPKVTFSFLKNDTLNLVNSDLIKLALLLGLNKNVYEIKEEDAIYGITKALDIKFETKKNILSNARHKLISLGEDNLVKLLPKTRRNIDDQIKEIENLF